MADVVEAVPAVPLGASDWGEAARLLEQALKAGNQDSNAAYLLAMCYKHLGRAADARQVLSRIAAPDANVYLQRGVLAFKERDYAAAAQDFLQSWEKEPTSYAAGYNLLLARLCQGAKEACLELIPRLTGLAPTPQEQRFLALLRTLLLLGETAPAQDSKRGDQEYLLGSMSLDEEERLVDVIGGLTSFEAAYPLLSQLISARPHSPVAFNAYFGVALLQGKHLMDRFLWEDAYSLLAGLARRLEGTGSKLDNMSLIALHNMLGVCSCMLQDFERGAWYFRQTSEIFQREHQTALGSPRHLNSQNVYQAAWIEQNLALAYEWQNRLEKAETHWNRYFDYLEHYFPASRPPDYLPGLAFEGLSRLADVYSKKEKWTTALGFLQRAHRVRPTDADTLERLFHLYTQLKRPEDARKTLRRLREIRPNDPQVELFEMDVREIKTPEDIDRTLADVRRVLQRFPGDMRVEERAGAMINNLVPALERLGEQYTGQLNKVVDQMRRLPSYQVNWTVVRNVMRDLEEKFFQLRRVAQKCLSLITTEELRRDVNSLISHCDRKIDQCHSLGE